MKKMSKTLLSMALVIAMLLSIMPMSFADGGETTSGVTIKYALSEILYEGAAETSKDFFSSEKTNGFYAIAAMSQTTIGTKYLKISPYNGTCGLLTVRPNNWLIFEINVPVAGTYELWANHNAKNTHGNIEAYIFPTSVAANASAFVTENYVGTLVCDTDYGAVGGMAGYVFSKDTAHAFKAEGENATHFFETPGKYYIGMMVVSDGDASENNDCQFADFYLVGGSGYALIGDMTISPDSVKAGESTKATATAYKSNDGTAATVTYSSSNTDVATVDGDGNITTGAEGTTTITATAVGAVNSFSKELTVTNTSDVTVNYRTMNLVNVDMKKETSEPGEFKNAINYATTNGFFKFYNDSLGDKYVAKNEIVTAGLNLFKYNYNQWIIFEVNVPVAGKYNLKTNNNINAAGGKMYAYIFPKAEIPEPTDSTLNSMTPIGYIDCDKDNGAKGGWEGSVGEYVATVDKANYFTDTGLQDGNKSAYTFDKGIYYIAFKAVDGYMYFTNFYLVGGSNDALMPSFSGNTTLEVGATATLKGFLSSTATAATVTYNSSNDCVTVSADGTITAAKPGKATVTMTASDSTVVAANPYTVEITVPNAKTDYVSVAIDDDGDGNVTITSAELGEDVTATAKVPEGKVFRGWVRGSADNGRLVSTESTYTFKAMTNIYLTAVYTAVPTVETDEYYNWDGQFLGNTEPTTVPSLVGYTFAKTWTKAKVEDLITSYIADFTKNDADYEVTANGFTVTNEDNKYDTEVTCTADSAVYWYRDGKLVDYGTEYKFFIWDNTTVTTSNEGNNGAKLMLDKAKGNSYMVEYDAGNATLLEVGILFGATGETPTVERCQEKMSSQRENFTHGQFTATSDYAVARGYLIYKDGDSYRVIYAD